MNGIDSAQLKMLGQMQRMTQMIQADQVGGRSQANWRAADHSGAFASYIRRQTDEVTALQKQSSRLKTAFELGDESVSLAEVMIASQKASVSFQAYAEVRNKLLSAYQEIMSMQV